LNKKREYSELGQKLLSFS